MAEEVSLLSLATRELMVGDDVEVWIRRYKRETHAMTFPRSCTRGDIISNRPLCQSASIRFDLAMSKFRVECPDASK